MTRDRIRLVALVILGGLVTLACGSSSRGDQKRGPGARGGSSSASGPSEPEAVPVELEEIERRPMSALYSTSGTLRAERRATVTARTNGVIEQLLAEEGDRVRAGEPLAELESDEQRIAAERARDTLETRRSELQRLERLYDQELVSEEAIEQARRDAQDAEHAADLAELELSRTVIRAPFDGVVVTRHLDMGNTVSPGTAVYTLADVSPLYLDVNVPERHVSRLSPGQRVRLTPDTAAEPVHATIERIAPAVDPETGTVKVTLTVESSRELRPGTFVRVDIITDTHEDALVVSRSALVSEGRRWYVYRVNDRTAEKIQVETGYESEEAVEILPAEDAVIAVGDPVVVAGAGALEDGSKVRLPGEEPAESQEREAAAR